ncbi:hypothetical protein D3C76_735980 [compost metagenome]
MLIGRGQERDLRDTGVMVTKQHKDGVVVVATGLGDFHQATDVEVQQAHGVVLLDTARSCGLDFLEGRVLDLESIIGLGDREGTMVASSLYIRKERFVLGQRLQELVGLLEQVQIGNAPDIHHRGFPVPLFVQANAVDALPNQGIHVGPAGVAADGVDLLVAGEGIDQGVLPGDQRVTRRSLLTRDVRDPGNAGPYGFCCAGHWHIEVLEEPALRGQAIEIGGRIDRVAVSPDGTGAQGFKHDKHHVRRS